jgi:hypothetical protein
MTRKYSKRKKNNKKKSKKIYIGGQETTQGCPICPANNPTPDELAWNNRYIFGKNTSSGWGYFKGGKNKNIQKGGNETTQGCPNCPANNPTPDELAWNNRYVFGKNTTSGWGCKGGRKSKKKKNNKKTVIYKKIDKLFREYYKNKLNLNY